ncbi:MAG: 50S ribosomal protein L25, partial [Lacrimispora celerecrescens]|nr:50S ribosomal protein L25 [Lacrimispora celerecrescens]
MENTGVMNVELRKSTRKGDNNQLKREGYLLGNIAGKGVDS